MKILEANAGALTNFEVLDFLRTKGASKDPTRVIAKVAQSEYKVYDYLVDTAASDQTRESINEFLTSIKQHDLAKAEVLNILNTRPAAEVELFPIIESCEGRLPDEEVTEIVELVTRTLPPPPSMKQEEITKVDEETATLKNENDEVLLNYERVIIFLNSSKFTLPSPSASCVAPLPWSFSIPAPPSTPSAPRTRSSRRRSCRTC
ncbi:DNA-directed RNA polymerase III subunit RPC9-like [Vigna umbellata]|uniref:DNA-directed RNA polymerase III subunit RPC9-like n=1 Tax=Vigna umbellata TaxID=87088 RepID=UPI001F5F2405|nr:DNA-directed RNA polymerase III subunit RPC9-like [Vigna umbellata]